MRGQWPGLLLNCQKDMQEVHARGQWGRRSARGGEEGEQEGGGHCQVVGRDQETGVEQENGGVEEIGGIEEVGRVEEIRRVEEN